jgi:hypothetical protein
MVASELAGLGVGSQPQSTMKFLSLPFFAVCVSCSSAPGPITPATPVERQMIGLLEKFDRWDLNGDGYLTKPELGKTEQLTGHSPDKVIAFYDTDGDGRISLKEGQKGLSRTDEAETAAAR